MEENQKNEETRIRREEYPVCANHPVMKTLFVGILIFLGSQFSLCKEGEGIHK